MNWFKRRMRSAWLLTFAMMLLNVAPTFSANTLNWRVPQGRVDADIQSWDVVTLLEHIANATGWQVYVEPGTSNVVSAKFKDRTPGDALRLMLPSLTAVLLPQTNAPAKLLVFRTTAQEATSLVKAPVSASKSKAKPIPNELVVTLKPGAKIEDIAKALGAKVVGRIDGSNLYRLQFEDAASTERARAALSNNEDVESVENNYPISRPPGVEPLGYGSAPPLDLKLRPPADGNKIIVGLLDTAVQPTGGPYDAFLLEGISVAGDSKSSSTQPTHGTSMAETIIRGMATMQSGQEGTGVRILPVDIYGNQESTTTFQVAEGIVKAVNGGANIINLSLGSAGGTPFLENVIKQAYDLGVRFYAAAGNEPVTTPTYPAYYEQVVAVTAQDRTGKIASYANRGDFVDVAGPGTAIVQFQDKAFVVTGTSASTAYVSGVAAATADRAQVPPSKVDAAIRENLAVKPTK